MMPFNALIRIPDAKQRIAAVSETWLTHVLTSVSLKIVTDEDRHLKFHRDMLDAIRHGTSSSAEDHYIKCRYLEVWMTCTGEVGSKRYLPEYPDFTEEIRPGLGVSPQHHFPRNRFKEGRRAHRDWVL